MLVELVDIGNTWLCSKAGENNNSSRNTSISDPLNPTSTSGGDRYDRLSVTRQDLATIYTGG